MHASANEIVKKTEDKFIISLIQNEKEKIRDFLKSELLDWKYIFSVFERNKIKALCAHTLLSYTLPPGMESTIIKYCKIALIEAEVNKKIYITELGKITREFNNNNIDLIVLKGLSIESSGLRDIGDLDLLIHEKDVINTFHIMQKLEYFYVDQWDIEPIKDVNKHRLFQFSGRTHFGYFNKNTKMLCEIHTRPFYYHKQFSENLNMLINKNSSFWDTMKYDPLLNCYILSNENLLILMCLHVAINRSLYRNKFILRGLCDINAIIYKGIDWDYFYLRVRELELNYHIYFALQLTSIMFDLSTVMTEIKKIKRDLKKQELYLARIHKKCFYSLTTGSLFYRKLYQFFLPFILSKSIIKKVRSILIFPLFFPALNIMEQIFHINRRIPLIYFTYFFMPFRWLYILIKRIFNKIDKKKVDK